ncbi:MAG: hypothetical protein JXA98_06050 [Methanosarcinaceae archaeon]|nr:hypothetical protein [Methanosarcinaceae archaeon]
MEENEDFSWKESKISTKDRLGKIVSIPPKTSDTIFEERSPYIDEGDEADVVVDVVKRRLTSVLSRQLQEK